MHNGTPRQAPRVEPAPADVQATRSVIAGRLHPLQRLHRRRPAGSQVVLTPRPPGPAAVCGSTHCRFRRLPPGTGPARAAARVPSMSGTAARSMTAETPLALASLNRWPSSPNPVTSVAHLIPAARARRLASALSVVISSIAAALALP